MSKVMETCRHYHIEMIRVSPRARYRNSGPFQPVIKKITKCDHPEPRKAIRHHVYHLGRSSSRIHITASASSTEGMKATSIIRQPIHRRWSGAKGPAPHLARTDRLPPGGVLCGSLPPRQDDEVWNRSPWSDGVPPVPDCHHAVAHLMRYPAPMF